MNIEQIAVIVITYNEEDNLDRTLGALHQFAEVIVLDSESTDRTVEIANKYDNVSVRARKFDNLKNQWNYGHTCTERSWILSLDADYFISPKLISEIETLDTGKVAFEAPFRYCIHGTPLRGTLLPPRPVLYNKDYCYYEQDGHAQKLIIRGSTGILRNAVLHDDRKPLNRWLLSQKMYADQELEKLNMPGVQLSIVDQLRKYTVLTPALVFLYTYIFKLGFLDGRRGVFYGLQRAYAELLFIMKRIDRVIQKSESNKNE